MLVTTLVVLAVLAGGLALLNTTRGPRLQSAAINLESVIAGPGQRLQLTADQPMADIDVAQVTVTPDAPVSVAVDGTAVTVTFDAALQYDTEYNIQIDPVVGLFQGARSSIEYDFTTADLELFTLFRDTRTTGDGTKQPDQIQRGTLVDAEAGDVVFTADRIQEFAVLPGHLAVVTLDREDRNHLTVVSLTDGTELEIAIPSDIVLTDLSTSGSTNLVGFTLAGVPTEGDNGPVDILYTYDVSGQSAVPQAVLGVDRQPLPVSDYLFVPNATSVVAHGPDEVMYLINVAAEDDIVPLGQHTELRGFIPGTNSLVVADPTQGSTIDLSNGTVTPLDLPADDDLGDAIPGKLEIVDEEGNYVRLYHAWGTDGAVRPLLADVTHSGTAFLYEPASANTDIRDFCVSPNGEYVAVETGSQDGESDDYPTLPATTGTMTTFVKIATGVTVRSINGFLPNWCT